ncbi:MAG: ATP-binding protein [Eubacteriales bacterium]|nr:ATP-binding protein [Eubacteriales bacterium]
MNLERMLFYDNIRNDENVVKAVNIIENGNSTAHADRKKAEVDYYELQRRLLREVRFGDPDLTFWQNYVAGLVADSENSFSLAAEKGEPDELTMSLAEGDAAEIIQLMNLDWSTASPRMHDDRPCVCMLKAPVKEDGRASVVAEALAYEPSEAIRKLAVYYRKKMCGELGRYNAFVWNGYLRGIEYPDPITFDDLIGYKTQQEQLIGNTETFLGGGRANNVLLYGDKGTGKSSSVKALLNKFADDGLRLISLPKDRILEINEVMNRVSDRGCKCIIFIDDLSFEASELQYKKFKSVLEGGIEVQPANVLVYVTSNRRNLVKEMWSDRGDSGEVHARDGMEERQSLADRFGLTITFSAPDKKLYEEIVRSVAKKEGVDMDEETLLKEAVKWDARQTGRSGRSARQFVTHIAGKKS